MTTTKITIPTLTLRIEEGIAALFSTPTSVPLAGTSYELLDRKLPTKEAA